MEIRLRPVSLILIISLWTDQINCFDYVKTISENNRIELNKNILTKDLNNNYKRQESQSSKFENDEESVRGVGDDASNIPHSRQKRLLWITNDGRLALPPGTSMVISPTLSLPLIRHPLDGFFSNISISLPLTVDFDKLGLTDNENPFGDLPPVFGRSFGRSIGQMTADFIGKFIFRRRGKRDVEDMPKEYVQKAMDVLHGGERALLFGAVEDLLANFGIEGKPCLLRAICEVHAHPLTNFGLLGEMVKLFLTASKSPYSHLLEEYVEAEKAGVGGEDGPGECWPYFKNCSKSLFIPKKNKYTVDAEKEHQEEDKLLDNVDDLHE